MYANSLSVAEARELYFGANGFSTAAYTERWVKLTLGPIPLVFPNTASRKRAIPLHDLHHVATGYATTFTGEAEIGAWEIGAGCGRYWAAWLLNLSAFGIGMWLSPRRVFRAFVRGRRSRSLYRDGSGHVSDLLALRVGELRARLALDRAVPSARAGDVVAFVAWINASVLLLVTSLTPLVIPVWLLAF